MVKIDVTYDGNLRCTATHGPSGKQLIQMHLLTIWVRVSHFSNRLVSYFYANLYYDNSCYKSGFKEN